MTEWTGVRDKRVLITGATRASAWQLREALARRGAQLAIVARDDARAAREQCGASRGRRRVQGGRALADLARRRRCGASPRRRSNATRASRSWSTTPARCSHARQVTVDGIEQTWALNHLAPFLLTTLLLDRLDGVGARADHHDHVGRAQGQAHPVRRPERRALVQGPRLHALRRDQARQHPLHDGAGAPPRGNRRHRVLLPSRASSPPASTATTGC